ncbi:sodium:solute symporter family protein [Crassaminicella profunda]|uniref:sodium:solute symporter family protein n=1 Tax=Crassaminicella profunda TaxID=1286698 RepID=UPI001CA78ACF|nr:sodium:solute symporter family protein [Crassaminicella profunda]QZY55918.1 sodium:solute symporter family protein [Crassaminicella profunda]
MNIPLIIVLCYIIALFVISAYAKKLATSGSEGFMLAGRKLTTPLIAVTVTGLAIGGASTIGVAERAYDVGLAAGWYNVAWGAGAVVMGLVAAGKYRKLNVSTLPELFEKFYDTKGRIICVLSQIVILLVITSLQYVAGGAILTSLLPDIFTLKSGMIMSAAVFIGITFIGGMWSAGLSNILNVALIYIGIIFSAVATISSQGGLRNIALKIPSDVAYLHPIKGLGLAVIMGWFAVMITQTLSLQATVQIACGAKDEKNAKRGFILGGLLMLPIGFLAALMGIAAKAAYPDISATMALPKIIMSLNPVMAGVTLAALWAADVSTACNLLLGTSTLFSQDIYKRFINPDIDDKRFMIVSKITVVILGIMTFILSLTIVGILKTLLVALSLTTAFTVTFLFTIFAPGLCRKHSAFYTTVVGILVLVLWTFVPSIRIFSHVIYLEWIVCIGTFLTVAVFDSAKIPDLA